MQEKSLMVENTKKAKDLEMAEEKAEGWRWVRRSSRARTQKKTTGFNNFLWLPP